MAKNNALYNLLVKKFVSAGARASVAEWAAAQAMYESNHGTSNVAKDNNLSGIKFAGQPGATRGRLSPEGNYYAKYASLNDWAKDFIRVLKRGPAQPWTESRDIQDYVKRLKDNRFFTDDAGRYLLNLISVHNSYNPAKITPVAPGPLDPGYKEHMRSGQARRDAEEDVRSGRYRDQVWQAEKIKEDEIRAGIPQTPFDKWLDDFSKGTQKALLIGGLGLLALIVITRR